MPDYEPSNAHTSANASGSSTFAPLGAADCHLCDDSRTVRRVTRISTRPRVHYGAIASGNQVVKNAIARDQYARELGVICFEMEAAGLMDTLPCIPIRGICDYSDTHKSKVWQKYAALVAASFARDMMEHLPVSESTADAITIQNNQTAAVDPASLSPSEKREPHRRQALLESLDFEQIDARKFHIKGAHAKTCRWFLELPAYQQWMDYGEIVNHYGFLWIRGKPGAGKSTIMKFIYSQMRKKDRVGFILTISFFFHARGALLERSIVGMYRSLLFQILSAFHDIQSIFDDPEIVPRMQTGCPSLEVLKSMLRHAILRLGQRCVTCYIDALDECDEQQVQDMVQFYEDLAGSAIKQGIRLKICFSSRHYPYIDIPAGIRLTLEDLEGHTSDLSEYISSTLRIKDYTLLEEVQKQLLEKSSGVFLWVVLVVDILNKENRRGRLALRKRLSEVPSGLMDLFRDLIKRDTQNMKDFRLCIMWILSAARPLTPEEYYHALWSGLAIEDLVDKKPPQVQAEDSEDCIKRCIISTSKGLVEIAKGKTATVQFIHESVRDFLIKDGGLYELWSGFGMDWESSSHELLKQCCGFYLDYESSARKPTETWQRRLEELPLLRYAAQSLLHHADGAADAFVQDDCLSYLDLKAWIHVHNAMEKAKSRCYETQTSLIYVLADRGCSRLTRQWLRANPTITVLRDECTTKSRYKRPLFAALASGHKDTISALLGAESTVVYDCDVSAILTTRTAFEGLVYKRRSPLTWAAQHGLTGLVKWILESGIDPDTRDSENYTALYRAARSGHTDVLQLLLDCGADVDKRLKNNETALWVAREQGHIRAVSVLLKHGANVNYEDEHGRTPLTLAVERNQVEWAGMLLKHGANVNHTDMQGRTSLILAANNLNFDLMSFLLDHHANFHPADDWGRTTFSHVALHGRLDVLKRIIGNEAEMVSRDAGISMALLNAASRGHADTVRFLLPKSVDDGDHWSALSWAYRHGNFEMAELLINKIDKLFVSSHMETCLTLATDKGHERAVRLLLDRRASINHIDQKGRTPLIHAIIHRQWSIVHLLITRNAYIHHQDEGGKTALSYAAFSGHTPTVQLLIRKGAFANINDFQRLTPWMHVSRGYHYETAATLGQYRAGINPHLADGYALLRALRHDAIELARTLIEHDASLNIKDSEGQTPLGLACRKQEFRLCKLLIRKGAQPDLPESNGRTPLIHICEKIGSILFLNDESTARQLEMVTFLIENGADVNYNDAEGLTPLLSACRGERVDLARLLIEKGSDVDKGDRADVTPLMYACRDGHSALVYLLIQKGARINRKDRYGATALKHAHRADRTEIMAYIIKKGGIY